MGAVAEKRPTRVVAASVVGTVIESYDFALYGLGAALVFDEQFFPAGDPGTGVLASLATFAVGFGARPVGGLVLGHFGDRIGRRPVMVTTLLLMGVATVGIGLLPTYDRIGILAPVLLVVLRLAQGFGAGAEYVGAILVVAESGPARGRGLRASLPGTGFFAGVFLANMIFAAVSTLPAAQFSAWGWRVPFLLSIVTVLVGLYFRLTVDETAAFRKARGVKPPDRFPIWVVISRQPRSLLITFAANGPSVALYYIVQVFVLSYVTETLGVSSTTGLAGYVAASVATMITVPLFGALSDRIGRRPVWLGGAAFMMIAAFPMFWLVETRDPARIVGAVTVVVAVGVAANVAAQASLFAELFATRYRYSGVTFARESSAALISGPAPFVAATLLHRFDASWPVAMLVVALAAISFVAIFFAPETRDVDLTRPD